MKPLPAEKCIQWVPSKLQSQPPAPHPLDVLVSQSVLADLKAHCDGSPNGGAAGLLVGAVFECPTSGRLWVQVSGTRPFAEPLGEDAELGEFGAIAIPLIQRTESAGERIVGWYHGHTSLGVYLSENESAIQDVHFPEMWQLGLITLSPGKAGGVFLRSPDGTLSRSGYWPFYEQLHASSYLPDGRLRTFVGWQNHRTGVPVSQVGEAGVTDSLTPSTSSDHRNASLSGETTPIRAKGAQGRRTEPPGALNEGPFQQRVDYSVVSRSEMSSGLGPGAPSGESEEKYFAHQLKRKLSAVDVTLSSLGPPVPQTSEPDGPAEDRGVGDQTAREARSDSPVVEPVEVARPSGVTATPAEPAGHLSPPGVRLSPRWLLIVLTMATAVVVGIIWLSSRGSADELDSPVGAETPGDLSVMEGEAPSAAAVGAIPGGRSSVDPREASSEPPGEATTPFSRALEILQQEIESYRRQQDEFARGLIGCNVLNSRYRSVDEAFLRLATALTESPNDSADHDAQQFEETGVSMDEVDQHFDASRCPRPR